MLTVHSEPGSEGLTVLRIEVRDTGIGIPHDRIEHLFESFTQADASTTRRFGGTGLGLAISRRLVELMGGRIWAESEGVPGRGSSFYLEVPVSEVELPSPSGVSENAIELRDRRVLVVDDNATNRYLVRMQCESWGMKVRDTALPSEALSWMERGDPFDIAVLDMQMPGMDGLELARAIGALQDHTPPVLIMSSLGRVEDAEGREQFAWLTKPVKPSQLFDTLISLLAGHPEKTAVVRSAGAADSMTGEFDPDMGNRHPLQILIAEDNPLNQQMALQMLARLGYSADVVGNGAEALDAVRGASYDVVLMDVQMPEMDGLEASRRLCSEFPFDVRPRIVAMTANALAGDSEGCLAAGMDDYIPKPIRVPELVAALGRVGAKGHIQAPASLPPPSEAKEYSILSALRRVVGDDDGAVLTLLDLFVTDSAPLFEQLMADRSIGDTEAFIRHAHTLKSNAASLGAEDFARTCTELEGTGKSGQMSNADPLFEQGRTQLSALLGEVQHVREELSHVN
jgi:CheY-like chemotaxis protein/HPt (histidine-containing phosphotransfer) domain-containing protein